MEIQVSDQECELLARLLDNDLRDLREQIYKTESHDVRESLKRDEESIRSLMQKVQGATTAKTV